MRFSIIVPVYQVEDYIEKCIQSIKDQTYQNFEAIIVDDGTKDQSIAIAERVIGKDKRFHIFHKPNGGLSDARNYGIRKAQGEYLLFVDSDDFLEEDLLERLNECIEKNKEIDLVRFQLVKEQDGASRNSDSVLFEAIQGEQAFRELTHAEYLEPAWCYAYRRDFWKKHFFQYEKGRYHEDFGLTPYIILKASSVASIPVYGYHYVIRKASITTTKDPVKRMKQIEDVLFFYDHLKEMVESDSKISSSTKAFFYSYLSNALLSRSKGIPKEGRTPYKEELKNRRVADFLLADTLPRKLKKFLVKHCLSFYLRFF